MPQPTHPHAPICHHATKSSSSSPAARVTHVEVALDAAHHPFVPRRNARPHPPSHVSPAAPVSLLCMACPAWHRGPSSPASALASSFATSQALTAPAARGAFGVPTAMASHDPHTCARHVVRGERVHSSHCWYMHMHMHMHMCMRMCIENRGHDHHSAIKIVIETSRALNYRSRHTTVAAYRQNLRSAKPTLAPLLLRPHAAGAFGDVAAWSGAAGCTAMMPWCR